MSPFPETYTGLATLAASGAAVGVAKQLFQDWVGTRKALAATIEEARNRAIASDDLKTLGAYLYDDVGRVTVASYLRNETLRQRVDAALDRVSDYVGREADIEPILEAPSNPRVDTDSFDGVGAQSARELREVQREIRNGQVWNALARLRRHIEITLRTLTGDEPTARPSSAGSLVRNLAKRGAISADAAGSLQYAIQVANRGIHGEDIDPGQAEEALLSAWIGLAELANPTRGGAR